MNFIFALDRIVEPTKESNPAVTAAVVIVIALIAGLIIWRQVKRRKAAKASGCPTCAGCSVKNCPSMSQNKEE